MHTPHISVIAAVAVVVAFTAFGTTTYGAIGSDGSIFFDTFDGPEVGGTIPSTGSFNPTGAGTEVIAPAFSHPEFFVHLGREGVFFNVVGDQPDTEQEFRVELDNGPAVDTEYAAELSWIIDTNGIPDVINGENATLLSGIGFANGEERALIRIEAKPSDTTYGKIQAEISADGNEGYIGLVGPEFDPGVPTKIVAHNLGDGTLDLYINDGLIGNYVSGPGSLEWFGNLGNNSSQIDHGGTMLLEYVSIGLPVEVVVGPTSLTGDANNDNQVTGGDLIAVQQNFGTVYPSDPSCDGQGFGDANKDCLVTGADLISVQQNFGVVASPAAVPEPAAGGLMLLSLVALARHRR